MEHREEVYAAITGREETPRHRREAGAHARTDERRIWFEAIQEEQAARKERPLAAVQRQLNEEARTC